MRALIFAFVLAVFISGGTTGILGQQAPNSQAPPDIKWTPDQEDHKLTSKMMGREMPYRVLLPYHWNRPHTKLPVIYLLHGLTGHFNNWTDLTKLREYVSNRQVIIVMPEGGDGWYTDNVSNEKE